MIHFLKKSVVFKTVIQNSFRLQKFIKIFDVFNNENKTIYFNGIDITFILENKIKVWNFELSGKCRYVIPGMECNRDSSIGR